MIESPYGALFEGLNHELQYYFISSMSLQLPFRAESIGPGDRFGTLELESIDDGSRAAFDRTPGGARSQAFTYNCVLILGVDCAELDDFRAQLLSHSIFVRECMNLEHSLKQFRENLSSAYGIFEDIEVLRPFDKVVKILINDRGLMVLQITCQVRLSWILWADTAGSGKHVQPIGS